MESESWPRNYSIVLRPLLQHLVASFGQRLIHRGTCNEKDMKDSKVLSCPVCRTGDRNRRPAHFISPIYRSSVPNKIHQHVGEANHGQISRGNDASLIRQNTTTIRSGRVGEGERRTNPIYHFAKIHLPPIVAVFPSEPFILLSLSSTNDPPVPGPFLSFSPLLWKMNYSSRQPKT